MSEDWILQRIARGDSPAVRDCLERYGGLIWSLARRFLGPTADAEDVVQEIFIELWKTADRFDPSKSSEATFITLIARRRLIDRKRRIGSRPVSSPLSAELIGEGPEPLAELSLQDESARALRYLSELPVEQQKVLKLALLGGCTHDEISRQTGLPLGTVKTHIRRGLIDVRERMQSAVSGRDGGAR